jgi:acetylornithine deacetylase/succinyl-diaminopimelate desuccinylase-like protein
LPQETPHAAMAHATEYLAAELGAAAAAVTHESPYSVYFGLSDECNGGLAAALSRTVREAGRPGGLIGVPYGTDAPAFSTAGIPTVVFGPGTIDQAHTADEWVAIDQLHAATDILYRFASQFRTHPE